MESTTYPARLIITQAEANKPLFVSVDCKALHTPAELAKRQTYLAQWAAAMGCRPYTYTPAAEAEAEQVAEVLRARLALDAAELAARDRWANEPAMLRRLERARELVETGAVRELGAGQWEVSSQNGGGTYWLNGRGCQCPDYTHRTLWCKHRLAVALTLKARVLLNGNGAESAATPSTPQPAPEETETWDHDTTEPTGLQDVDWAAELQDAADWYELQEERRAASNGTL
jgi:hypothetical protein